MGQWRGRGWYSGAIEVSNLTAKKKHIQGDLHNFCHVLVTYQLAFHVLSTPSPSFNSVLVVTLPQAKWKSALFGSM